MRLWWLMPCLLVLVGCQVTPERLPSAEPRPAAECRWEAGDIGGGEWARRALAVFEEEGFVVRHTELALGLVSAERSERVYGFDDFYDYRMRPGVFGSYGVGRRGGFSTGVAVGIGVGVGPSSLRGEATRLERVSLVADDEWVRLSRDIQVIDWRGELRQARSASDAEFCDRLRDAMATAVPGEAP
jgi:hypothetical protein